MPGKRFESGKRFRAIRAIRFDNQAQIVPGACTSRKSGMTIWSSGQVLEKGANIQSVGFRHALE